MTASVNIVVAMNSEAKPLIDHFGLERKTHQRDSFSIFGIDRLNLIVSGIGSNKAREAVRFLSQRSEFTEVNAWLNVGVVGHGSYDIGTGFLVNCIVDRVTQRTLYPSFTIEFDLLAGKITTVNVVETEYQEDTGYDMEAFDFAESASRFSTLELIHCFKVVSDNKDNSVQHLTKTDIRNLIADHVDTIDLLCSQLQELAESVALRLNSADSTAAFASRWRMTVAQRQMLKKYLRKSKVLNKEIKVDSDVIRDCRNASIMLKSVERYLNQHWKTL